MNSFITVLQFAAYLRICLLYLKCFIYCKTYYDIPLVRKILVNGLHRDGHVE